VGAPHWTGGSRRTGSEIRGPLGFDETAGCGVMKRSPVADQGPERAEEDQLPWMREEEAAERAGRKARPAVPTRGPPADGARVANDGSGTVLASSPPDVLGREAAACAAKPPLVPGREAIPAPDAMRLLDGMVEDSIYSAVPCCL
jgi:hypothetical protein